MTVPQPIIKLLRKLNFDVSNKVKTILFVVIQRIVLSSSLMSCQKSTKYRKDMLIADKDRNDNEVVRKLVNEAEKYSLEEHKMSDLNAI